MVVAKQGGEAYDVDSDHVDSDHNVSGHRRNKRRLSDDDDENLRDVEEEEYDSEEDEDYVDRPKKKKKHSAVSKFIVDEAGKHFLCVIVLGDSSRLVIYLYQEWLTCCMPVSAQGVLGTIVLHIYTVSQKSSTPNSWW